MIPQLLLLAIFLIWGYTAFRSRFQSPEHLHQYRVTMIFIMLFLTILYWGDFFDVLIQRIN